MEALEFAKKAGYAVSVLQASNTTLRRNAQQQQQQLMALSAWTLSLMV